MISSFTDVFQESYSTKTKYVDGMIYILRAFQADLREIVGVHLGLAEGSLGKTRTSWNGVWGVPGGPWRGPLALWG